MEDLTRRVRTPPDQHRQKRLDKRDQERTVRPDLEKSETKQTKPNGAATPSILRQATAFHSAITLPDQLSASTANRAD